MKVLITGANGFIGTHLCDYLAQFGIEIVAAMRGEKKGAYPCFTVQTIDAKTDWNAALSGVDVVVHLAARVHVLHEGVTDSESQFRRTNIDGTIHLARQTKAAGAKRFIFISTVGVHGNYSDHPLDEMDPIRPSNSYSASKWRAEEELQKCSDETGLEIVIIRPPLVYGEGVKANFLKLMEHVYSKKPMPFGRVKNRRDFVSVRNLCSLIHRCLDHPAAAGETYLVCDGESISTTTLIKMLATQMGCSSYLVPIPVRFLHFCARLLHKERLYHSVCASLRINPQKAKEQLSWQPIETLHAGLKHTVDWYVSEVKRR